VPRERSDRRRDYRTAVTTRGGDPGASATRPDGRGDGCRRGRLDVAEGRRSGTAGDASPCCRSRTSATIPSATTSRPV
jgi:hypothetical protein